MTGHFEISCANCATDRSQTCPYGAVNEQLFRRGGSETLPLARRTYPKVQIFTVEDFFDGKRPDLRALCGPRHVSDTLKKAKRIEKANDNKPELGL